MTTQILQIAYGQGSTALTITITANAGSYLDVYCMSQPYTANCTSITDGTNTYTLQQNLADTVDNWGVNHYTAGPIATTGAITLTAHYNNSPGTTYGFAFEIGNSTGYLTSTGQYIASTGVGTDVFGSGLLGTLAIPRAFIIGVAVNTPGGTTPNMWGGTGYIDLGYNLTGESAKFSRLEYRTLYANTSVAATFGIDTSTKRIALACAWGIPLSPTRVYANGHFFSNTFIEGGTQLNNTLLMKEYANGTTQILKLGEISGKQARLYANGTYTCNQFSEI